MNRFMALYWRLFSFMVRRVMAIAFILGGIIVGASGIPALLPGGTINYDGVPTDDIVLRLAVAVFPLALAALGVALFRTAPCSPGAHRDNAEHDA